MKCDNLTAYIDGYCYSKAEVDEAIAELKDCKDEWAKQCTRLTAENTELKSEIEQLKNIPHTDNSAVIDSLQQKLHDAEMRADLAEAAETERKIDYDNLKKDLAYHARQIYFRHNRQTLMALWLSRAIAAKRERDYWYHVHQITRSLDGEWFNVNHRGQGHLGLYKRPIEWVKTWDKVRELCRKKADEFKEVM